MLSISAWPIHRSGASGESGSREVGKSGSGEASHSSHAELVEASRLGHPARRDPSLTLRLTAWRLPGYALLDSSAPRLLGSTHAVAPGAVGSGHGAPLMRAKTN